MWYGLNTIAKNMPSERLFQIIFLLPSKNDEISDLIFSDPEVRRHSHVAGARKSEHIAQSWIVQRFNPYELKIESSIFQRNGGSILEIFHAQDMKAI